MTDPIDLVSSKLRRLTPTGDRSWKACCPAHEDKNPSLSVSVGDDGRVLLKCFAGCDVEEVLRALDLESRDLFRQHTNHQRPKPQEQVRPKPRPTPRLSSLASVQDSYAASLGKPNTIWHYQDSDGETVGATFRWDKPDGTKEIRPGWRFPDGWSQSIPAVRPLFQLPQVLNEPDRVFVAEGEKAAAAITSLGFTATTSPGGSKAAERADWSSIQSETVVILPDADPSGQRYADDVRKCLIDSGFKGDIAVLNLPGLQSNSSDDAVEWIERVHKSDDVAAASALVVASGLAIEKVRRARPLLTVAEILSDSSFHTPPDTLRSGVPWFDGIQPFGGLERGTLTLFAAPPRCYKSTVLLFLGWQYAEQGLRVHYLAGEMTRFALTRRIVAMAAEVSPSVVSDPRNPRLAQRVKDAMDRVSDLGDRLVFGRAPITLDGISMSAGVADVVIVDYLQLVQPDTAHAGSGRVDELDATMRSILAVTQQGGTVLAAASLNRTGRDTASLSSIRGSSAIEYGATTVYTTTEELAGFKKDGAFFDTVDVEYTCVKQREGVPKPLRFRVDLPIGPLPTAPVL